MSKETFWTDELVKKILREVTSFEAPEHWNKIVSEFKQSKMPKKEWEIVEFISPRGGKIRKEDDATSWDEWGVKSFVGLTINAVKRFSDMTIWYVGEKPGNLLGKHDANVITKFSIREDGSMWVNGPGFGMNLNDLEKLPPQSKKEIVEVIKMTSYNPLSHAIGIVTGEPISEKKFPTIKASIERVLNDEDGFDADLEKTIREADELKKP